MLKKTLLAVCLASSINNASALDFTFGSGTVFPGILNNPNNAVQGNEDFITFAFQNDVVLAVDNSSVFNTSIGQGILDTSDFDVGSVAFNNMGGQSITLINGDVRITDAQGNVIFDDFVDDLIAGGNAGLVVETSNLSFNSGDPITVVSGSFAENFVNIIEVMEGIAQVEQEQTQSENTVRVTSNVIGNHFVDVISLAFGLGASPSEPGIGTPEENQIGASSDSGKGYSPDAFWGKHIYTNLTEDGGNLGYDTDLYQFIGGLDKRIGNFFFGSAISYVYGETNQAGNNNSTHTIGITPYAAYKINDFLFASGLASYNYTSVNGTEGRRDADVHNYSGELTLNAFKAIDSFIVKGRGGLRYTHNYTSLEGTIDGSYDQLTWIGDVEFGYHVNNKVNVFTGVLYEYIDKEATVGTNVLAVNNVTHDGVVYARAGVNYRVNDELSFGLDASSDLNDEDNDIMSFGASVRLEM